MPTKNRINGSAVGVDGCRAGWFTVAINRKGEWTFDIFSNIRDIWQRMSPIADQILIDIPIGLSENGSRICDVMARKILKNRASSVFPTPCRKALEAESYQHASQINYLKTGKKLSVQTWNIASRIREVDEFLTITSQARGRIRESHPEVSLWALAGAQPMNFNKKTADGYREREQILKQHYPQSGQMIKSVESMFSRKDLAKDDIIDALALAVTGLAPSETIVSLPPNPPRDNKQFSMEIVYSNQLINPL
jgi:predicted RNase H-like nuclease